MKTFSKIVTLLAIALLSPMSTALAIECMLGAGVTLSCSGTMDRCYTINWSASDDCESTITIEKTGCLGTVWLPVASGIDPSDGSYEDCTTLGNGSYKYRVTIVCGGECTCVTNCQHVSDCLTCP